MAVIHYLNKTQKYRQYLNFYKTLIYIKPRLNKKFYVSPHLKCARSFAKFS